jgi:phosphoenolpyruvate---glycerone phosphotransferase subunit DhaL
MTTVTKEQIVQWLESTAAVLNENAAYLTQLDSPIGDADHGTNMDRGFKKVMEKLPTVADKDIGNILKTVGMTLISSVGGASGPLYGTFFMRGGMAVDAKEELDNSDMIALLQAAVDGVIQRGRAQPGDKTMIDALLPALAALKDGAAAARTSSMR